MRLASAVLFAALWAAGAAAPGPRDVRLSEQALTIYLTDGTVCRLKNWQARPEGRFEACAPGLGYRVTLDTRKNPFRQLMEGIERAVGGAYLVPMAEVLLIDAAGREYRFTSPRPERNRD